MTAVNTSVAETVYSIASFSGGARAASIALSAGMAGVVIWAVVCWRWGIPTSESHALVAGITGAAVALEGDLSCVHWESWGKVLLGLLLSTAAGFWCGRVAGRAAQGWLGSERLFRGLQLPGAAATAFFHGAQDGQKFLGIFLLGVALVQGRQDEQTFVMPLWLLVFCAGGMALGTGMGGRRIIDTVGREMVTLSPREALPATWREWAACWRPPCWACPSPPPTPAPPPCWGWAPPEERERIGGWRGPSPWPGA